MEKIMSLKVVLFDLDGTLLPMDQEVFIKSYFKGIAARLVPYGYEPKPFVDAILAGTARMIKNDGKATNEKVFWECFKSIYGDGVEKDLPHFDAFYRENFDAIKEVCGYNPAASETVKELKSAGIRVALATNPVFPAVATEKRIRWAGLKPEDFELYTTYENSKYCKPNPLYYKEILEKLGAKPEECLMVGNDVGDDMIAEVLGMKVFLLTDCLINKTDKPVSAYPNGSFAELNRYINENK